MLKWLDAASRWALVLLSLLVIAAELPRALPGDALMDFGSFVASGRAAREGLNPYGIYPLTFHVSFPGFEAWNPNLNPPVSALLFQAFDLAEPHRSFRIWCAISASCWLIAVALIVRRYGSGPLEKIAIALWMLALAGFWDTLVLGQIYLPLVLAGIAAWLLLERGSGTAAGILIGLVVAMKPNFLVWPALLFLSGHYRPALVSGVTAACVSAVPLGLYGPEVYRQWLELIASDRDRAAFLTNASMAGLAARLGAPAFALVVSVALLGGAALWALLRRPNALRASSFGILVALLASPLAWIHYTLFLVPVLLARWRRLSARAVAALLVVPVPFIVDQFGKPAWIQASIGSVYNWALLLCLVILLTDHRAEEREGRAIAGADANRAGSGLRATTA